MEIRTIGGGRRLCEAERVLCSGRCSGFDGRIILLPIPTSKDKKYITSTERTIASILPLILEGSLVVGYDIPKEISDRATLVGALLYDGGLDEEFLIRNAVLTARGAIGYLLTAFDRDISDMKIGIVGYGRIGSELLRLILTLSSNVRVYTTRRSVAIELGESGVEAEVVSEDSDFSDLNLLINTAPARQISLSRLPEDVGVIDLASGINFDPSPRVIRLSSIPEAYYPITAGRLYAGAVEKLLLSEGKI